MVKSCAVTKVKNNKIVCDESRSNLLPRLQKIQDKKGYISDRDMQIVADEFRIHPVEVFSVVSFYHFLSHKKKGRYIIRVSTCPSSMMAGAERTIKAFEKALKIEVGQTTKDGRFTLERTSCIGMCDQAPAVLLNDELIGKVTVQKVKKILPRFKKQLSS
jgi:NADH:ubiquinone oxidoreductase subunit E